MTQPPTTRSKFLDALSWCRAILLMGPLIYLYTIVLGTCSLLASLVDRKGSVQHRLARIWSWLILHTSLCRVEVRGLERIDTSKPHVYAANHISALDIPTLYLHLPFQFRILAKKELFTYPFLGWHLRRSGQLPIDQSKPIASLRSLKRAVETINCGMPLVIFPEGGRSRTGQVRPFMSGAFYIAIKSKVDVVPLAIVGTYEVLPMNHFHIRPGRIQLLVGEPISTQGLGLNDIETLSSRAQDAIERLYYAHSRVPDPAKLTATTAD